MLFQQYFKFFMILLHHQLYSHCFATCSSNIVKLNEGLHVLFDNQTDLNNARSVCSNSGGNLAQIANELSLNKSKLISHFRKVLITEELALVEIYQNPDTKNLYKYRSSNGFIDVENIQSWATPKENNLQRFMLYKRPVGDFNQNVTFCYHYKRDLVVLDCAFGWMFNFKLVGGSDKLNNTIPLYPYRNKVTGLLSTNLFLHEQVNDDDLIKSSPNVYLPDISVFIGATSNVNQSTWHWDNGTIVNNTMFPPANSSICQQMTWPLTYDDGINLRAKECEKQSYFICKFEFTIEVEDYPCNGSNLKVSWKNFSRITNKYSDFQVQITIANITQTVPFQQSEAIVSGLQPRTNYHVQARLTSPSCEANVLLATASGRTGHGLPDAVTNPRIVKSNNSHCAVEWDHDNSDSITYKIHSFTSNKRVPIIEMIDVEKPQSNDTIRKELDLSAFSENATVIIQIQALSCEGEGPLTNVIGNCTKLIPTSTAPTTDYPQQIQALSCEGEGPLTNVIGNCTKLIPTSTAPTTDYPQQTSNPTTDNIPLLPSYLSSNDWEIVGFVLIGLLLLALIINIVFLIQWKMKQRKPIQYHGHSVSSPHSQQTNDLQMKSQKTRNWKTYTT